MATPDEEFMKQLREVFDLCDELKCGYISVDHLKKIINNRLGGSDEEFSQLIECLDPERHGVVTFADFCRGAVAALHNKSNAPSLEELLDRPKPKFVIGSPSESGTSAEGIRQEDFSPACHPGCEDDSAIATGSDVSRESFREDKHDSPSDGEENYVCVGHLSKPTDLNNSLRSNSSTGSNSGGGNNRRRRSSRMFQRTGSKRQLSSAAISSQLLRSSSRNGSRRNSESSDELFPNGPMSLENDVIDLNQKVEELQHQVATLSDHQANTDERYTKVKQENAVLQTKIHCLEEQLKELELRSDDRLKEEQKQFREIMARHERESKHEVEQYANRFFTLQQEYMHLSEEKIRIQAQMEKLKQEKTSIEDKFLETQAELAGFREEHQRLQEAIRHERANFASEIANSKKAVEELTKELESVRQSKLDLRARSPSLLELPAQYRELETELRKVKDENKQILETNEELHAQLLSTSLQEGRSLLHQHGVSLADEFENLTKDEITNALLELKEDNAKLRAYIDGILLNILENHPQLLEVKNA